VPGEGALLSGLKLVSAALTVGLVPGVLCLLASGLATQVSLLETAALGIAVSLAIAQGLTMAILLLHVPVAAAAVALSIRATTRPASRISASWPGVLISIDGIRLSRIAPLPPCNTVPADMGTS